MTQEEKDIIHKKLVQVSNTIATCGVTSATSPTIIDRTRAVELQVMISEVRSIISMSETSPSFVEGVKE